MVLEDILYEKIINRLSDFKWEFIKMDNDGNLYKSTKKYKKYKLNYYLNKDYLHVDIFKRNILFYKYYISYKIESDGIKRIYLKVKNNILNEIIEVLPSFDKEKEI